MNINIDKNIPVPPRGVSKYRDTLANMKPGDSVFFAGFSTVGTKGPYNAAMTFQSEQKGKVAFQGRTVLEDGVRGVRIWRIK